MYHNFMSCRFKFKREFLTLITKVEVLSASSVSTSATYQWLHTLERVTRVLKVALGEVWVFLWFGKLFVKLSLTYVDSYVLCSIDKT